MNKSEIIRKLTSRKWLTAIAGVVIGAMMIFGGVDESEVMDVAGAFTAGISILSGIIAETVVDVTREKAKASVESEKAKANATIPVNITYNSADGTAEIDNPEAG